MEHLIEFQSVYKIYQMGEETVHALDGVTLTIDEGDFIGVIGCNRAGKSTLCKSVVGILPFVPGGGIYYTMEYCLSGNTQLFLSTGIHTFGVAGAVAVGILLVSSVTRLLRPVRMVQDR